MTQLLEWLARSTGPGASSAAGGVMHQDADGVNPTEPTGSFGIHRPVYNGGPGVAAAQVSEPPPAWWPPDTPWAPSGSSIGRLSIDAAALLARRQHSIGRRQLAMVERLMRTTDDPATKAQLDAMARLNRRMLRSADAQLILVGAGHGKPGRVDVRLTEVLRSVLAQVEGSQRVELITTVDPVVVGHLASSLEHLVAELVENALAASAEASGVVVQTAMAETGVQIRVIDSGPGLAPVDLDRGNALLATAQVPSGASDASWGRHQLGLFTCAQLSAILDSPVVLSCAPSGGAMVTISCSHALMVEALSEPAGAVREIDVRALDAAPAATLNPDDTSETDHGGEEVDAAHAVPPPLPPEPGPDRPSPPELEVPHEEEATSALGPEAAPTDVIDNAYQPEVSMTEGQRPLSRRPRPTTE